VQTRGVRGRAQLGCGSARGKRLGHGSAGGRRLDHERAGVSRAGGMRGTRLT
jgi:hypothetical protein